MTTTPLSNTSTEQEVYMFPASFAQQRLWFLDQLEPNTATYNICSTAQINGSLDIEALKQSLNTIVERHEVLRTAFAINDGQPVQVLAAAMSLPLPLLDLQHLPEAEREAEALRLAQEEACRPFDLTQAPLLRTTLLKLDAQTHVLLLCIHHIIFDGWSGGLFFQELETLYRASAHGQPAILPELPIQYVDFTIWQREWMQGNKLEEQLTYWRKQLAGAPAALELPTDRPRPAITTRRGSRYFLQLSKQLTEALKALSQQEGVSLFMTLTAAFKTLLHRYTAQDDLLLGTVTADRSQAETENLIGFFVNTLILRTDLSGNPTFRQLLGRVREVILDAHAHQDVPFEYLVKELQPDRSLGQNPFFQVMLVLEPTRPTLSAGWTLNQMDIETGTAKFDLHLELQDRPEGLRCCFEYSTDLFDEATIARMAGHWQTFLEGAAHHPEQHLSDLPLLTQAERHQLLIDWNATATDYPEDQCVHRLFEAQVERTPDAVALIFAEQQMTYQELNRRSNQLAHHLQRLGVGSQVLVGLCMDRSIEMIVGLLGILKAGGAYVPLDPAYPEERLAFMLQDTQAPVLLTQRQFIDMLPTQGIHVLCLDSEWSIMDQERTENLDSGATAENLAYVMYTSGSTGRPKGVQIRHRSIARLLFGVNYVRLDATRTLLHMAPISFDASTLEVWGALLHGARCILFPERVPTPRSIGIAVRKYDVTTVWLTTALFNAVIDEAPDALLGTEQVLTGGDVVSVAHIRRALNLLPSTELINGYGPTESTTFTTCYSIPRQLSENIRSIPIGRPIGNTQVYILDRNLNPVPIGIPGELHIGGAGLARGYLNRPELTDEKFIDNPWSSEPGAKLYKTGDLVRYLSDGAIEFLGRFDHQVKIRGFRIELGEIEVVLGQHAAVREALVLAYKSDRGDKRLVAYVVPIEKQNITVDELRLFLKERLPDYMVPSDFMLMDFMPMTPNGKVDRQALPTPVLAGRTAENIFVAPTLRVHYELQQIWEELLDVKPIGIRDDFFSLGGHSLLAARMIDRIEQVCGKKLPLATLFAGATIENLADALLKDGNTHKNEDSDSRVKVVNVQVGGSKRPFFFLHGDWHGGGLYCLNLAASLSKDQPFYTLEPYRFEGLPIPPTLESMAAAHIEAMRAVQPEGPYLLGGWCNGGLIAYEMARQLYAAGQAVDLLVAMDIATPYSHRLIRKIISRIGDLIGLGQDKQVDLFLRYIYLRIPSFRKRTTESAGLKTAKQTERKNSKIGFALSKFKSIFPAVEDLRYNWFGIYRWVAAGYTPGRYPGKLTLFWSNETGPRSIDWRKLSGAKEVEDHIFPGTHVMYGNESLPVVAEGLNTCLIAAQATVSNE